MTLDSHCHLKNSDSFWPELKPVLNRGFVICQQSLIHHCYPRGPIEYLIHQDTTCIILPLTSNTVEVQQCIYNHGTHLSWYIWRKTDFLLAPADMKQPFGGAATGSTEKWCPMARWVPWTENMLTQQPSFGISSPVDDSPRWPAVGKELLPHQCSWESVEDQSLHQGRCPATGVAASVMLSGNVMDRGT